VEACFGEQEIFQLELKDLARAQAVLQHKGDNGEISEGAKPFPEAGDLVRGEGHDHAARLSQAQVGRNLGLPAAVAKRRARGIPALKEVVSRESPVRNGSDTSNAARTSGD